MKFVLGLAIGVALGLVLAPASSEETRTQLKQKARDFNHYRERQAQEKLQEVGTATEQKAGEIGSRVGRDVAQADVKAIPAKSSVRTNRARSKNKQGQRA